ncbi:hypothetical protein F6P93_06355 [Escherichia coli]|nr:hypothetical protein F6P93_06355 [Escherichia coli]
MKESESEVSWSSQKSKRKHYFTRYSAATMTGKKKDVWRHFATSRGRGLFLISSVSIMMAFYSICIT